ncbi:MAG: hypothetical protein PSV23_14925 [Brevundimonas sp.]|uniref:hypothetical protein n=1 Tax=Brevundimonas sp. TaxID=1871086 RepID=UPI002487E19D|nr:hypothetical protein [Brevundimonas sp.]MDI1328083.1 hypothetical protein [Brevundimonas sp.]
MRMLTVAAGAALLILAASPAFAGGPTGGGRPGCGGGCGGGGHPGGGRNINVNVNANASASAYAGASARSYLNARTYNVGGARGAVGGGAVYVGGGYGGDAGGFYGVPVYNEAVYQGRACAPAPFGYVLGGFGRDERYAPVCGSRYYEDGDRGGRYGYSERHDSYAGSRYEESRYESYEEYGSFEARSAYRDADYGRREERHEDRGGDYVTGAREYDRGYMDGRRDCDCRPDGRDGEPYVHAPEPAPYGYAPEPPPASVYEAPMTPNQYYGIGGEAPSPRQQYRQEPGERG